MNRRFLIGATVFIAGVSVIFTVADLFAGNFFLAGLWLIVSALNARNLLALLTTKD